jgi:hypothetical protein
MSSSSVPPQRPETVAPLNERLVFPLLLVVQQRHDFSSNGGTQRVESRPDSLPDGVHLFLASRENRSYRITLLG